MRPARALFCSACAAWFSRDFLLGFPQPGASLQGIARFSKNNQVSKEMQIFQCLKISFRINGSAREANKKHQPELFFVAPRALFC